jgi:hypothetical protein
VALEALEDRTVPAPVKYGLFTGVSYDDFKAPTAPGMMDGIPTKGLASVVTGQFTSDAMATDIAVANMDTNNVSVLLEDTKMDGTPYGTFRQNSDPTVMPPHLHIYNVGVAPHQVIAAKLRGDMSPVDLITVNLGSNNISVLLGNGNGTFQNAVNYPANDSAITGARFPISIAAGDFNGDGKLDLVVVDNTSLPGYASILLGNGDGTFQLPHTFSLDDAPNGNFAENPTSVAVGDFNGDGNLDFVVANGISNNVAVFFGRGDGTFRLPGDPPGVPLPQYLGNLGNSPAYVAVAPLHKLTTNPALMGNPNALDIVTANIDSINSVAVLVGVGNGTFLPAVTYSVGISPVALAIGNVHGTTDDSKLDVVVADHSVSSNSVKVLLGTGDDMNVNGGVFDFTTLASYGAGEGPTSVALADFNGDKLQDIVVANQGDPGLPPPVGNLTVLLNNGNTLASLPPPPNGLYAQPPDPVYPDATATSVTVGTGARPWAVAAADFNGDGVTDLVEVNAAANEVQVFLGNKDPMTNLFDGTFKTPVLFKTDLSTVITDFFPDPMNPIQVGQTPYGVVVGNFGRHTDGKLDFAVVCFGIPGTSSGALEVFLNNGLDANGDLTFTRPLLDPTDITSTPIVDDSPAFPHGRLAIRAATTAWSIATADFNGDGNPDIAVLTARDDALGLPATLNIFLNRVDANGLFFQQVYQHDLGIPNLLVNPDPGFPDPIITGKFHGENNPVDIVVGNFGFGAGAGSSLVYFRGLGDGSFVDPVIGASPQFNFPIGLATADFRGDPMNPRHDLVVANLTAPGTVSVFLNTGSGAFPFSDPAYFDAGINPRAVTVGDFNNDGQIDIAVANISSNTVSVLLNNSTTTVFQLKRPIHFVTGRFPTAVIAAKIFGSGMGATNNPDIVTADVFGDTLTILRNLTATDMDWSDVLGPDATGAGGSGGSGGAGGSGIPPGSGDGAFSPFGRGQLSLGSENTLLPVLTRPPLDIRMVDRFFTLATPPVLWEGLHSRKGNRAENMGEWGNVI